MEIIYASFSQSKNKPEQIVYEPHNLDLRNPNLLIYIIIDERPINLCY